MKNNKSNKRSKNNKRTRGGSLVLVPRPLAYQKPFRIVIPGTSFTVSTAAGTVATVNNINVGALINSFSTRFANTYREYRMTRAQFKILPILNGQGGAMYGYINESDSTTPTLALAQNSQGAIRFVPNLQVSDSDKLYIEWRNRDIGEQGFVSTATTTNNYAYLMFYTDSANLGQTNNSTIILIVDPIITLEFRGMK
jgi:hypothetical protein